jgi:glycosyltransferase involved in cell wall biosynthesis
MKIAFIGQKGIPAHVGGVERYVEELTVRLAVHGHEIVVYTRPNYTPKEMKEYKGIRLISLLSIGTKHLDAISHTVLASLDVLFRKVDVIHYQSIGPALVAWLPKLLNRKIRIVSTLQCRDYEHQKWGAFARFMLRLGERSMCRFSDELIVATESIATYVRNEYGISATVIPNGATIPAHQTDDSLLATWNLTANNYFLAVSRFVKHKGLDYLVDAYNTMTTDKKLVIVGDGSFTDEYAKSLRLRAQSNPNIIFTGTQTGEVLAALYDNAYLFVQPSESEGISMALLEAMARGKAVISSDIIENSETVGETAYKFRNKDIASLRAALETLSVDSVLAKRLGTAAQERVKLLYDWETITERTAKIYKNALRKPSLFYRSRALASRWSRMIPLF